MMNCGKEFAREQNKNKDSWNRRIWSKMCKLLQVTSQEPVRPIYSSLLWSFVQTSAQEWCLSSDMNIKYINIDHGIYQGRCISRMKIKDFYTSLFELYEIKKMHISIINSSFASLPCIMKRFSIRMKLQNQFTPSLKEVDRIFITHIHAENRMTVGETVLQQRVISFWKRSRSECHPARLELNASGFMSGRT